MEGVWGLEHPILTTVMKNIAALGSEYAYMALLPLVFWCVDERKGLRLGIVGLLSASITIGLQEPSIRRAYESSGFLSGLTQVSVASWGILGSWIPLPGGLILAVGAPAAISLAHLYLGVHLPRDLLVGWVLGALVLALYFGLARLLGAALGAANIRVRILIAAAVAVTMNALNPANTGLGGGFFGMAAGYVLMADRFPFSAAYGAAYGAADAGAPLGPRLILAARYLLGMAGFAAIYLGLKLLIPEVGSPWYALGNFIHYALLGAWVSAGAPWVFLRLRLACGPILEPTEEVA